MEDSHYRRVTEPELPDLGEGHATLARKMFSAFVNPPPVALHDDGEHNQVVIGPFTITPAPVERPKIGGVALVPGFVLEVAVTHPGSRWEPPTEDVVEVSKHHTFTGAVSRAADEWFRRMSENACEFFDPAQNRDVLPGGE